VEELVGVTRTPGGVARQYAEILPRLRDLGVDVEVLVVTRRETIEHAALGYPIRVLRPPSWARGVIWMIWGSWQVRKASATGDFDAVLATEWLGLAALLPRGVPQLTNLVTGARLLDEISGHPRRRLVSRLSRRVQYALEARQIRRATGVIAISVAVRDWYREAGFHLRQVDVIPNCIDVEHVARASSTAPLPPAWPIGVPTLLFVGRLERRKGIDDVIVAFRELAEARPDLTLVLAGAFGESAVELDAGGLRDAVAEYIDRVVVLGPVQGDGLYRAMAEADVVMCPSRWEAFGLVALEAKAAGAALVVTRGSGFDDFCEDGSDCLMVDPASPRQLARAVMDVLDDPSAASDLRRKAQASAQKCSPDRVVPRYVDSAQSWGIGS
jgi:glycosyltransferase involved in cell wall biosynthesis